MRFSASRKGRLRVRIDAIATAIEFATSDFEQNASLSLTATLYVPLSCGHGGLCSALALAAQGTLPGATCATDDDNPGDCVCSAPIGRDANSSGSYSTVDTTLTLDGEESEYCASDGTLHYVDSVLDIPFVWEAAAE